jgi:hypothetical protein
MCCLRSMISFVFSADSLAGRTLPETVSGTESVLRGKRGRSNNRDHVEAKRFRQASATSQLLPSTRRSSSRIAVKISQNK